MSATRDQGASTRRELYLICPRCRLSLSPRVGWLTIEHCPRCFGRTQTAVPMLSSPLPAAELYHEHSTPGPPADVTGYS